MKKTFLSLVKAIGSLVKAIGGIAIIVGISSCEKQEAKVKVREVETVLQAAYEAPIAWRTGESVAVFDVEIGSISEFTVNSSYTSITASTTSITASSTATATTTTATATLVGTLSDTVDNPVYAIYPYAAIAPQSDGGILSQSFPQSLEANKDALVQWLEDSLKITAIPRTQIISANETIAAQAYIQLGYAPSHTDTLIFTPACSMLEFTLDCEDVEAIEIQLDDDAYTIKPEAGRFNQGTYAAVVRPGAYATCTATIRAATGRYKTATVTNAFELAAGARAIIQPAASQTKTASIQPASSQPDTPSQILPATQSGWRCEYKITKTSTLPNFYDFVEQGGLASLISEDQMALLKTMANAFLPKREEQLRAYTFTYPSIDPQGQPVTLSAMLYLPQCAFDGTKLDGMVLANHYSITSNSECPTNSNDMHLAAAWKNYAVVMSDYCGFGVDAEHPQAYLNPDVTAYGNINALLAAKAALDALSAEGVSYGGKLYNIGYSQGGFNAMANLRYLSAHPELDVHVTKTFAGGGPFDVTAIWSEYLTGSYPQAVSFLPVTIASFNECARLGLDYSKIFQEPLCSHIDDWILSKKYSRGQISSLMGTTDVNKVLTDGIRSGSSTEYARLMELSELYSLTGGWAPEKGSFIYIYHSQQDDIVPYVCFENMKRHLDSAATDSFIKYFGGEDGGHMNGAVQWMSMMLFNW